MSTIRVPRSRWLPVVLVAALAAAPAGAQVVDPGFETGALAPWFNDQDFCSVSCAPWAVTAADAHSGLFSAEASGNIEIRQDFAPVPTAGVSSFTFWLRHPNLVDAPAFVSFFYTDLTSSSQIVNTTTGDWEFFDVTGLLTAGKTLSGFSIFGYNGGSTPPITRLDDVTLVAVGVVPEPTTVTLLAGALALLGAGTLRARRRA
jgi:hypothetical protein